MLILKNITKIYRSGWKKVLALKDIYLTINSGEITVILGPNGAGKTTLFKIMAGLVYPDSGEIIIKNEHKKYSVAYVPTSERSFYFRLSGWDNLYFWGALWKLPKRVVKDKVNTFLDNYPMLNIDEKLLERPYMTYSRGEKQKLNLLRAFITNAKILLLDEPTSFTDPVSTNEILNFVSLYRRNEDVYILYATHNLKEAEQIADRAILLKKGAVIRDLRKNHLKEIKEKRYIKVVADRSNYEKLKKIRLNHNKTFSFSGALYIEVDKAKEAENTYKYLLQMLENTSIMADIKVEQATLEHLFIEMMEDK